MTNREHDTRLLGELLARVEGAEGADRELDCAIALALGTAWTVERNEPGFVGKYMRGEYGPVTASLDAALALVERVQCGGTWRVETCTHGGAEATVWPDGITAWVGQGHTPALALLAALLRALITQAQPSQTGESGEGKGEGR